jgi:hypothetical protein
VSIGYPVTDALQSGEAGPNAALRARIPLWDRSNDLKNAQARGTWKRAEDSVRRAFLEDIQALCEQAAQVRALDTLRGFHRDILTDCREPVDQGLAEPDTLWVETKAAPAGRARLAARGRKLQAQFLTLTRRERGISKLIGAQPTILTSGTGRSPNPTVTGQGRYPRTAPIEGRRPRGRDPKGLQFAIVPLPPRQRPPLRRIQVALRTGKPGSRGCPRTTQTGRYGAVGESRLCRESGHDRWF